MRSASGPVPISPRPEAVAREGRPIVATVTAPSRESLVEAVAAVQAAAGTMHQLLGVDHPAAEHFELLASEIRANVLGPPEDEWKPDHPTVVEIVARADEIEADALEVSSVNKRVALLRLRAADYREKGTTDLDFHTGEPMGGEW
jgi:hypothetical protein